MTCSSCGRKIIINGECGDRLNGKCLGGYSKKSLSSFGEIKYDDDDEYRDPFSNRYPDYIRKR